MYQKNKNKKIKDKVTWEKKMEHKKINSIQWRKKIHFFMPGKKNLWKWRLRSSASIQDFEVVPQFKIGIYYAYCIISIVNVFISKAPTLSIVKTSDILLRSNLDRLTFYSTILPILCLFVCLFRPSLIDMSSTIP